MGVDSSSEPEHANINTVSDRTRKDRNLNMRANSNSGIISSRFKRAAGLPMIPKDSRAKCVK